MPIVQRSRDGDRRGYNTGMAKILLIEDDESVCEAICDFLTNQLHTVEVASLARDAIALLETFPFDAIVLDLGMPDLEGLEVLNAYRKSGGTAPVLILTGRQSLDDREIGLDSGADDYLCKPFHVRELSARLRALLRRAPALRQSTPSIGDLVLDRDTCALIRGARSIRLRPKEFALLELFMRNPDRIFNAEAIIDRLWQSDTDTSPEIVRVHITKLRNKVDIEGQPSLITTIKGVGYKFESAACKPHDPA